MPATPSAKQAARRALKVAFAGVRKKLLRVFDAPADAAAIHKLRVAVRRAVAAMDAFAPCLPRRVVKLARRTLRTVRRAAGTARDWDVFFTAVSGWATPQPTEVRAFADALLGWAAAKRDTAQAAVVRLREFYPDSLDNARSELLGRLRRPRGGAALGRERVAALSEELAAACEVEPTADADYHRVRIVGKRLRYAAELFPEGAADDLDARLRELQESLGRLNDGVVGEQHLAAFDRHFREFHPVEWGRLEAGAAAYATHLATTRDEARAQFRAWRTADRVADSRRESDRGRDG